MKTSHFNLKHIVILIGLALAWIIQENAKGSTGASCKETLAILLKRGDNISERLETAMGYRKTIAKLAEGRIFKSLDSFGHNFLATDSTPREHLQASPIHSFDLDTRKRIHALHTLRSLVIDNPCCVEQHARLLELLDKEVEHYREADWNEAINLLVFFNRLYGQGFNKP